MSPKTMIPARESVDIKAPYVIRNQTGLRLMVVVDGQRLRTTDDSLITKSASFQGLGSADRKTVLVRHIIDMGQSIGFFDTFVNKAVSLSLDIPIVPLSSTSLIY